MRIRSVLFVNQSLGWGGAEVFNSQLLNWMSQAGVEVTSYVTHPKFATQLPHPYRIPIVIDIIGDWKGLVKGLLLLPLAIIYYGWLTWSQRRNDVIFMTGFIEKILVTPWAKLFGIPVVWVEFAPLTTVFAKFWGLPKLLYFLVKNLPNEVIVPTCYTQASMPWLNSVVIPCAYG